MVKDSVRLEAEQEPAQAFDKLARGFESLLPGFSGGTQAAKWRSYFTVAFRDEAIWRQHRGLPDAAVRLARELAEYVARSNVSAMEELRQIGERHRDAVARDTRTEAAEAFANFVALLRNKRFHGDPAFSGHNFRIARAAHSFLGLLRLHLEANL